MALTGEGEIPADNGMWLTHSSYGIDITLSKKFLSTSF